MIGQKKKPNLPWPWEGVHIGDRALPVQNRNTAFGETILFWEGRNATETVTTWDQIPLIYFLRDSAGLWSPAELSRACVTVFAESWKKGHSTYLSLEPVTHLMFQGLDIVRLGTSASCFLTCYCWYTSKLLVFVDLLTSFIISNSFSVNFLVFSRHTVISANN